MIQKDVAIIGGGISGLTAGLSLMRAGYTVDLFEAKPAAGGNLRSLHEGDYICEIGPHAFMAGADAMWRLVREAGLEDKCAQAAASSEKRFVVRDGRLHVLPNGAWSFISSGLLSFSGKCRLCVEPFIARGGSESESARAFFTRRLGKEAVDWLVGPFISGIYGGDPDQLGARDAFFKMWSWERESGSMIKGGRKYMKGKARERAGLPKRHGLYSFTGGLGVLADGVAALLGESLHAGEPVLSVAKTPEGFVVKSAQREISAKRLVVAVPPKDAAALLAPGFAKLARELDEIVLSPMALVHLAVNGDDSRAIPDGFGFLVPRSQGLRTLGCLFASRMFPERAPQGHTLLAAYVGGMLDPGALALGEEELVELVRKELSGLLGRELSPCFAKVLKNAQAIPQLLPGHRARVERAKTLAGEVGGLYLAGNYLSGVGVNDAVESGFLAAEALLNDLTENR